MHYMLLIYRAEELEDELGSEAFHKKLKAYRELIQEMKDNGHHLGAEPLKPIASATTLRKTDGRITTLDGPFAETKEQLAGYFLLDCPDLDCAMDYASRIPVLDIGCVEIRPLLDLSQYAD